MGTSVRNLIVRMVMETVSIVLKSAVRISIRIGGD